jgi:pimeloyl-ACP methyl ester carboxylesterase
MKALKKLLLLIAVSSLLFSCSKNDSFLNDDSFLKSKLSDHQYGYDKVNTEAQGLDQDRYVTMQVVNNYDQLIDLKVHYRIIGQGPVDIVWIPGWTNPLTMYTKQFDYFRDKARSIYIELPGHGLSDAPEGVEYTQGLMADALYNIIRKEGVKEFIGIGHSWGSSPLKQFEIRHPGMITQLVLLGVGIPTWPPMNQTTRDAIYSTQMAWTTANKTPVVTPAIDAEYYEIAKYFIDFPDWLLANMYYYWLDEDACKPYPWNIPVLGIWRTMSPANETIMNQHFPDVDIQVIGGTYHVIQWFQADLVNQLIADFITDRPGKKY